MTCPHKYAGQNPGVIYPVWRQRHETLAWHYRNETPHHTHLCAINKGVDLVQNVVIKPFRYVPMDEVERLMAALQGRFDWLDETVMQSWFDKRTIEVYRAYHTLKGKMG